MKTILLTGASGVIGQALIAELRDTRLLCLVHRAPVRGPQMTSLQGDITRPRLGLTRGEYNEVAGRIDLIVHAAAITDFEQPAATITTTNIDGTRHIVELARTAGVPLIYTGTAFSRMRSSIDRFDANAYETSKRAAEDIVRASDVPAVIVRPSIVVGDSRTGAIARFQGFHFILSMWMRGLLPIGAVGPTSLVDFIPQDIVARTIAGLIARGDRDGDYWVTLGDHALTPERIVEICVAAANAGGNKRVARPRMYSYETFDRLIRPVFFDALPPQMRQSFERAMSVARYINIDAPFPSSMPTLEAQFGIVLPSPDTVLMRNLDHWLQHHARAA
jgi:nucleoside-diphosphate-sugar epimerase